MWSLAFSLTFTWVIAVAFVVDETVANPFLAFKVSASANVGELAFCEKMVMTHEKDFPKLARNLPSPSVAWHALYSRFGGGPRFLRQSGTGGPPSRERRVTLSG